MPLKIIGAGYGRTGTLSTKTALDHLGFPCYHMVEVLANEENEGHLEFWNQVATSPAGQQHDWETVFANYTATVDNPGCCVWKELMQAYPDAKVILTLHPKGAEAWYNSTMDTIYFSKKLWQFKVLEFFTKKGRIMGSMLNKLIWDRSHKGTMENKEAAIAHYQAHIEDVKANVPADKLLIFTADQGWGPLCEFLGVDVPNDIDFPNVNDRGEVKATIANIVKGAYTILAMVGGAAIVAILLVNWLMRSLF